MISQKAAKCSIISRMKQNKTGQSGIKKNRIHQETGAFHSLIVHSILRIIPFY